MALCALCLLPVQLLRRKTPELALLLIAAALVAVAGQVLVWVVPLLEELRELFEQAGVEGSYVDILLKTVAASLVSRFGADLCRDGGSQSLAGVVELAGTAAVMTILLPLLQAVVGMLLELWKGGAFP